MRALILASALALLLAGCGAAKNTITPPPSTANQLAIELDGAPSADYVGLYEAQALGLFRQTDLDVRVLTPSTPSAPIDDLESGAVQVAVTDEPDVLLARNANKVVAAFGAIDQQPLAAVVSPAKAKIGTLARLRGARLGYSGLPGQAAVLGGLLAHAGVPQTSLDLRDVGAGLLPALTAHSVRAILGNWNLDPLALPHAKHPPNVIRVSPTVGVPTYEGLVLVARKETIVNHAGLLRRFVQALARGYAAARANPVGATQNLVRLNPSLNGRLELAAVRATMSSFFPSDPKHPWGWQDPDEWNAFGSWLADKRHLLTNPNAIPDASTNELLAGQGV